MIKKWKKIKTKKVYKFGKYYQVEIDQIIRPSGELGEYSTVRLPSYVVIIPIDKDNNIYFVRQHRYSHNQFELALPAGSTDGEDALTAGKLELEEEVGLGSDNWINLGNIREGIGWADSLGYIFIAKDVYKVKNPRIDSCDINLFEVIKYSIEEAKQMIIDGTIKDVSTICAISKAIFLNKL